MGKNLQIVTIDTSASSGTFNLEFSARKSLKLKNLAFYNDGTITANFLLHIKRITPYQPFCIFVEQKGIQRYDVNYDISDRPLQLGETLAWKISTPAGVPTTSTGDLSFQLEMV